MTDVDDDVPDGAFASSRSFVRELARMTRSAYCIYVDDAVASREAMDLQFSFPDTPCRTEDDLLLALDADPRTQEADLIKVTGGIEDERTVLDAEIRLNSTTWYRLRTLDLKPDYMATLVTDISVEKAAQNLYAADLKRTLLQKMVYRAAHDINNLIYVISSNFELISSIAPSAADLDRPIENGFSASQETISILDRLSAFAESEPGTKTMVTCPTLLEKVASLLQVVVPKDVSVELGTSHPAAVIVDSVGLQVAMVVLLRTLAGTGHDIDQIQLSARPLTDAEAEAGKFPRRKPFVLLAGAAGKRVSNNSSAGHVAFETLSVVSEEEPDAVPKPLRDLIAAEGGRLAYRESGGRPVAIGVALPAE